MKIMKNMKRFAVGIISVILIAVMLLSLLSSAWAEEVSAEEAAPAAESYGIIDSAALNTMVLDYLGEHSISTKDISVGLCYTATGDTWYYNGDTWFYPASMYKVPLMMLVAEKVKAGEYTPDTEIRGMTISQIETYVLTYSNNDWAHVIRETLSGSKDDTPWRKEAMKYSTIPESEYNANYLAACYYSNRYMTEVMKTLFANPEEYPNVIESLLPANPGEYLRARVEGRFDIAQKYGAYQDNSNNIWMNATAIFYTDNPIIITVMTKNVTNAENVIADLGLKLADYSASLDGQLTAYTNKVQKEAEEAERLEQQRIQQAEQEKINAQRQAEEKAAREQAIRDQQQKQEKRKYVLFSTVVIAAMIAAVAAIIVSVVEGKKQAAQAKRYAAYRRRYEAEQRSLEADRPRRSTQPQRYSYDDSDGYSPRH